METIILSILLSIGLYQIDYASQISFIGLLIYLIAGIFYLIGGYRINSNLGIKTNIFSTINNFLIHISITILLLILVYGFNGSSLGEGRILHNGIIQYLVFLVFLIPFLIGFQIYLIKGNFKNFKFTLLYVLLPIYFLISPNQQGNMNLELKKTKLFSIILFLSFVIVLLGIYIIQGSLLNSVFGNKSKDLNNQTLHRFK